ncbi:hypothetical protein EV144_1011495 [Flavobacterium sp. 270]|uniref:hypothetical protein n=1 Tax=Flavobacterium sp. 270 TaxID=2512114 RepID=UPI0010654956|nr:hypothetical protein [Flavobacterium sp. 270]TDW52802.1 hypothetical protein EV144_1011495 [Flavobacterium sp. 270]
MERITEILGLQIHAIIHYYNQKKISMSFENSNIRIQFNNCPLVFDSGIIGKKVKVAEQYRGEMSFVLVFREMKLDVDDYRYFMLKGEEGNEHYQNQIRIAYQSFEIIYDGL